MAGYDFDILRALGAISLVVAIDCPGFQTERELIFGDNCAFWQEQPHPTTLSPMRGSASVSTINIWRRCNGQGQYTFWLVFQICLVASVSTINIWRRCSGLANLSSLVFLMLEMVENICWVRDNWHHCSFASAVGNFLESCQNFESETMFTNFQLPLFSTMGTLPDSFINILTLGSS